MLQKNCGTPIGAPQFDWRPTAVVGRVPGLSVSGFREVVTGTVFVPASRRQNAEANRWWESSFVPIMKRSGGF